MSVDKGQSDLDVAFQVNQIAISERKREIRLEKPESLSKYGRFACGNHEIYNIEMVNSKLLTHFK